MRVGDLIATGRTADVHAFGPGRVVKIPRPSTPLHWAEVEASLSAAVHDKGLPVPSMLDLVEIDGRQCAVFERVPGPSMWEQMQRQPGDVATFMNDLVDVQRRIHASSLPARMPALATRLRTKVSACAAIDDHARREAEIMIDAVPAGAALLHGDLHPGNVLLGPDGPVVIDWFDASVGHPAADIVRSSLLLRLGFEGVDRRDLPSSVQRLLDQAHEAYLNAWRSSSGASIDAAGGDVVGQWEPLLALARIGEGADEETAPLLELWDRRSVLSAG